jgi:glycosyltransferase involved in cell wall biosynthesis
MHKKTLMFYINAIHDGGAERVIIQLAHHFAEVGYRSILVTSFVDINEYPVPDNVERISIEQEQIMQSKLKRNVSRIVALRKLCKKYKPAALISFMAEPNFRALVATVGLPVKNIVSVRNDPNREYGGNLGGFVGKHMIPHADGCVFQTEEAKGWFPKDFQKKSAVIMNDVDKVFFETERIGGSHIVTLGRLSLQKNQKLLINAYSKIAQKYPETDLLIYGIGALKDELEEQIRALGLNNRVQLMGLTNDAPTILSNAGYFLLSSDYEGMPNALMEALAVGVPCISTDCPCGGPRMLINNGKNGLLIPVGDENKLVEALECVLSNKEYAERLGKNAKNEAYKYRTEKVFEQWKNYIEKIITIH